MCTTSLGQPSLPAVYIQHPIVSVPNVEMEGRAEHAMAAVPPKEGAEPRDLPEAARPAVTA